MIAKWLVSAFFLFAGKCLFAQYTLNGSASKNDCHCYTLTQDAFSQTGSIWNNNKISLAQSFDFKFDVFLGCADNNGADGIAFVLQPISTSVGTVGSGLGYSGVSPSVGVTIDTWQNGSPTTPDEDGDPYFDHIAIQINGDLNHRDSVAPLPVNNIAGPVTALSGNDNIEDCQWHILRIKWDVTTKTLSAYIDGIFRLSAVKDFTTEVFGNDPSVFWGFTGSTGGAKNLQQMCTALKPVFSFLPYQKRCVGEKITFIDSTISFAPVQKSFWDFGDGSPVDSINTNPEHTYTAAGNYSVTQAVIGADGCLETNTKTIVIGSIPVADFNFNNACMLDSAVNFINTSSAAFGTLDNWYWDLGDGDTSTSQHPSKVYATPGLKTISMAVKSLEGCASDTITHVVQVYEKPVAGFSFINNRCTNAVVQFNGVSTVGDGVIDSWQWNLDTANNKLSDSISPSTTYDSSGLHIVSLVTKSQYGCASNIVVKPVNILPQPIAYFKNGPICISVPVVLADSSYTTGANIVNGWWWDLGNGVKATTKNSKATYNVPGDITVQLVVKSTNGCVSDTLKKLVGIETLPMARFSYDLPLCKGRPNLFSDSSLIVSGTIRAWSWSLDNGNPDTTQNVVAVFSGGSHQVRLVVQNTNGCNSTPFIANIFVNPLPVIDFSIANACKDTNVIFTGVPMSGPTITGWQWNFDDGTISTARDTQHIYTAAGDFLVRLFAVSATGCSSDTISRNIRIYATDAFAGNDTIAATNQPVQLQASGGVSYEWSPAAGLSNAHIAAPLATNNKDRSYILKALTPFGCASFDTINIKIYDGPEIYVPTAFTPNGDGLNELLKALPVGVKQFKNFTVYNRLGQIVFITSAPSRGWDGFFNGKAQNPGAYIWTATAIGYAGNEILRKGTVMLIR
ncbi:MAG: PKD domain-containing protein [Ferruginibacter sp.]